MFCFVFAWNMFLPSFSEIHFYAATIVGNCYANSFIFLMTSFHRFPKFAFLLISATLHFNFNFSFNQIDLVYLYSPYCIVCCVLGISTHSIFICLNFGYLLWGKIGDWIWFCLILFHLKSFYSSNIPNIFHPFQVDILC